LGAYFGREAPVDSAEVFLDGIISTLESAEMCAAFSANGKEFFFNAQLDGSWTIIATREEAGRWTRPTPISFTAGFTDRDFTISPDGNRIFFGSNRPVNSGDGPTESLDIYVTERSAGDAWSKPVNVGHPVNTDRGENYPSVARNGNLYFFSCGGPGVGGCDIFISEFSDGGYEPPRNLGPAINSDKHDWDAYVAPDESYLIFSSMDRDDSLGDQDLYISFRMDDGRWSPARNMGPRVNSPDSEITPSVSLDGRFLFFTSRRRGRADIFWIDASIIRELRPSEH
jgi:Tol biopolymer transport system component